MKTVGFVALVLVLVSAIWVVSATLFWVTWNFFLAPDLGIPEIRFWTALFVTLVLGLGVGSSRK